MRVAYDEQVFCFQRVGGVSRLFVELIRQFVDHPELGVQPQLPFRSVWNEHAARGLTDLGVTATRLPAAPYPLLAAAMARPRRRPDGIQAVHHTFYHRRFLRDFPGVPKVVTVYDMIPELLGERGRFGNPHMAKREFVARADLLLCISESARRDMVAVYGPPSAPVEVTHLAVDPRFRPGAPIPLGLPAHYLLFVGRRGGYKDFATFLDAATVLLQEDPDLQVLAVGGGPWSDAESESLDHRGLAGRVHQRHVSDADLPGVYAAADAFVFPSRYEGFGLPVLEAMASGAPAVLADTSSLPEVGGDAAVYFPPGDVDALVSAVRRLRSEPSLRADLVSAGLARAAAFTWSATAAATARAYRHHLDPEGSP